MNSAEDWFKKGMEWLDLSRGASLSEYDSDLNNALDAFNEAVALDPAHFESQWERGQLFVHFKDHEAALDAFVVAASLRPSDFHLHLAAGRSLHALKYFDRALGAFDEVLRLHPDHDVALEGRAESLTALERDELAVAAWDEAIRVLDVRQVEHGGRMIRDLTDDWRAQRAREARAKVVARAAR